MIRPLLLISLCCAAVAAEPSATELALRKAGAETPPFIPLWPDKPPQFAENAPPETVDEAARIQCVSVPAISVFPADPARRNGIALIVCTGGGYGSLDWKMHVMYAAQVFNPLGVTVVGLKYRLRSANKLDNAGIQALALLDAKRAVRLVRNRVSEWGIDPHKIGVAGHSAGANLTMNLAANFQPGDANASDPIERESSRPDFVVTLGMWHWRKAENPFVFKKDSPPAYLVHATTDKPIEISTNIAADLKKLGVPVRLDLFEEGAHGVGNLIPTRVAHDFPPAKWPWLMLEWLAQLPQPIR